MGGGSSRGSPSRATILGWLRLNLGVTVFIFGLASGGFTMLVGTTRSIGDAQNQIHENQRQIAEQGAELHALRNETADVVRRAAEDIERLKESRRSRDDQVTIVQGRISVLEESRHNRDEQMAGLLGRIAVLEAQVRFMADHIQAHAGGVGLTLSGATKSTEGRKP